MSQRKYFLYRSAQTVLLLWLVLTFLFFFIRMLPGSFSDLMLQQGQSPDTALAFEEHWGLNDPLYVQYFRYLANLLQGDLGTSLRFGVPVWEYVHMKIFNSFILIAPGITLAYGIGSIIGAVMGNRRGSRLEKYGIVPFIGIGAFPSFFTAILLVIFFAGALDLFPTSGMIGFETSVAFKDASWWRPYFTRDFASHYVLPFTAIILRYLYLPILIMRTSIVEVKGQDFIFYHRMTGLSRSKRLRTLIKHAILPVITLYPVSMTRAVGGLVLIEVVFNWPGIGNALIQAVFSRDFPVVQFVFLFVAVFVILANFVVDIAYGIIDPRVSLDD